SFIYSKSESARGTAKPNTDTKKTEGDQFNGKQRRFVPQACPAMDSLMKQTIPMNLNLNVYLGYPETNVRRCRRHIDCDVAQGTNQFGYMCVRRTCVVVERSNYSCRRRRRCGIGGRCINGVCYNLWNGFATGNNALADTDNLPEYDGPDALATSAEELQDDMAE
ncbi:hypothetical protein D918_07126, partial [Trichuris suis]